MNKRIFSIITKNSATIKSKFIDKTSQFIDLFSSYYLNLVYLFHHEKTTITYYK